MTLFIIIFGALTLLAGLVIVINPDFVFGYLRKNLDRFILHILAVVIRLVLGILLVHQSGISRFPIIIEVIGWLSIVAAISLAVIGRRNFNRLMSWALSLVKPAVRIGGVIAVAFGGFLIYAFV